MGYKYYDGVGKTVAFPFGYGLTYTEFIINNLFVSVYYDTISISIDVLNSGNVEAAEVIQVYTAYNGKCDGLNVLKQFREFTKVSVKPNDSISVSLKLSKKDITSTWADDKKQWMSTPGEYRIFVGNSSDNLRLYKDIYFQFDLYYWL